MDIDDSCFVETAGASNIEVLSEKDLIGKTIIKFKDFGDVNSGSAHATKIDDSDALCIDESSQTSSPYSDSDQTNLFVKRAVNVKVTSLYPYSSSTVENWTKNSAMLLTDVPDSVVGEVSNQDGSLDSQIGTMCKNNCVILQQNTPDKYSELCSYDQDAKILLVPKRSKPDVTEVVLGSNEIVVGDSLNIDFSHFLVDSSNTKTNSQFYDNIDYAVGKLEANQNKYNYSDDKYYDCPSCFYSTQKRDKLDRHIQKHVLLEGYHPCGKKRHTTNTPALRYRHNAEEYRCCFCPYTCTVYKAYKKHKKIHLSGEVDCSVKLSCKICGKDRSSDAEMHKHMKKHRDGKRFLCDVCKFGSAQMKKIIQHRRMHTGEKPHLCPHCNYRSSRRDNLRSHVRRMHKKENMYIDTFNPTELNSSDVSD